MIYKIKNLENKSTGPQSIPIKLLKLIPDLIPVPLGKIINMTFLSDKYRDYKGASAIELNNYPPISLLTIFDKIIEKLMHKRLYNFL